MDVRYRRGPSTVFPPRDDRGWIGVEEAGERYLSAKVLTVASTELRADGSAAWQLRIDPQGWFHLAFNGDLGTPLREVSWEPLEGTLVPRETRDHFYPEGDPGRRVPDAEATWVTRQFFVGGRVRVVLQAPNLDLPRTLTGVDVAVLTHPVPAFGRWASLVQASTPSAADRYGEAASDTALATALDDLGGQDVTGEPGLVSLDTEGGWVMAATSRQILEIAEAFANGAPVPYGATVLTRGPAGIIPLGIQGDAAKGADPAEAERSLSALDSAVRGLLSHVAHDPRDFFASWRGWYDTEAAAVHFDLLQAAGITMARTTYLPPENRFAVMLVWAGDVARGTRTLALHVVPAHWCNDRLEGDPPTGVDLRWGRDDLVVT